MQMNNHTDDAKRAAFDVLPRRIVAGKNKNAGYIKREPSGKWLAVCGAGCRIFDTESEAEAFVRNNPAKLPPKPREKKPKAPVKPEGLATGGLTLSDASLGLFDTLRKLAGLVTASPGGRYRLRTKTVDRVFDTQAEAMVAGTRAIRDEEATAKAAKKRAKAEAPTNVGPTP
jgi:hypothetical protein